MRMLHVIVSAVVGGAIGFAASHTVSQRDDPAPMVAAAVKQAVKEAVDQRLAALDVETAADLEGKISGGVAQFLADSPEAVVAALEKYQANEQAREAEQRKDAVRNLSSVLTEQAADPVLGADAATADITVVEFFDYRCGYCKRALDGVVALADEDKKIRVVLKEFPILGPDSVTAARVSLAANKIDPSMHFPLHEALMRHRGSFDETTLLGLAAATGYDPLKVAEMMKSEEISAHIRQTYEAAEALGIRGTPAFVIGDEIIPGAISKSAMQDAVRAARAG